MDEILRITEDHRALAAEAYRFGKEVLGPLADKHEAEKVIKPDAWQKLAEFGALGLSFPTEYGGSGVDPLGCTLVGESFGRAGADGGLMLSWGAHSFLFGATLAEFCSPEQMQRYLPKLATGEIIGAFALTEPGAGSDAGGLRATYRPVEGGYVLNGQKTYITNAPEGGLYLIFATKDPSLKQMGISAFLVERDTDGLSIGPPMDKLCVRASGTAEVFLEDCFVPAENLVSAEGMGFFVGLTALEWDRSQLLSPLVGLMERSLDQAIEYALQREQFGRPIAEFHAVQSMVARLSSYITGSRWMVRRIAALKGQGGMHALEAAAAKCFCGGRATAMASLAVQAFGGAGLMDEVKVERAFRDSKLASIGGGTTEVQHLIMSKLLRDDRGALKPREIVLPDAAPALLATVLEGANKGRAWLLDTLAAADEIDAGGRPLAKTAPFGKQLSEAYVSLDAVCLMIEAALVNEETDLERLALETAIELRHGWWLLHEMAVESLAGLPDAEHDAGLTKRSEETRSWLARFPAAAQLEDQLAEHLFVGYR
ncbi:MAG: acyl-CoA dehydrogenase family protein [Candidatus Lernaella stagnicola]|nr:acyl-CoA dehydrogenase family protein [Candidatus Lernaella stagnicola]